MSRPKGWTCRPALRTNTAGFRRRHPLRLARLCPWAGRSRRPSFALFRNGPNRLSRRRQSRTFRRSPHPAPFYAFRRPLRPARRAPRRRCRPRSMKRCGLARSGRRAAGSSLRLARKARLASPSLCPKRPTTLQGGWVARSLPSAPEPMPASTSSLAATTCASSFGTSAATRPLPWRLTTPVPRGCASGWRGLETRERLAAPNGWRAYRSPRRATTWLRSLEPARPRSAASPPRWRLLVAHGQLAPWPLSRRLAPSLTLPRLRGPLAPLWRAISNRARSAACRSCQGDAPRRNLIRTTKQ